MKLNRILTGIVCLASCGAAFASPLSTATYNLFSTDTDNIQSVNDYSSVNFDKYIASSNFTSSSINAGGAFRFGDIYLSPWYSGYLVSSSSTSNDTKSFSDSFDGSGNLTSETVTDSYYRTGSGNVSSTFNLLIGFNNFSFGPLGIKLGYSNSGTSLYKGTYLGSSSYLTGTTTTVTDEDGNEVSSESTLYDDDGCYGTVVNKPSVLAGTVIKYGDYIFKPKAGLTFNISDKTAAGEKTVSSNPSVDTVSLTYTVKYDNYTIGIMPVIGTSVDFPKNKNGFEYSASFSYEPDFKIYNYNGDEGTKNSTYKKSSDGSETTTYVVEGTKYDSDYSNEQNIYLGYTMKYVMDEKITVKAAYNAQFEFTFDKYSSSYVTKTTKEESDILGSTETTYTEYTSSNYNYDNSGFYLSHSLSGALQYHVIPAKLDFNFGARVTLPYFNYSDSKSNMMPDTTYEKTIAADGTVSESNSNGTQTNASEDVSSSWGSLSCYVRTGLTWFLNENVSIDSALTLGITDSYNSVFGNSLNLGCTLKF